MMRFSLQDIYNYLQQTSYPQTTALLNYLSLPFDVREFYRGESLYMDNYILSKYGELKTSREFETIAQATSNFMSIMESTLLYNRYKYKTLSGTMFLYYNPIWNVDGTTTIKKTGSDTFVKGEENNTTTSIIGSRTDSTNYGEDKTTLVNGEVVTETETDERHQTTTNANNPFDAPSTQSVDVNKSDVVTQSTLDTTTTQSVTDTSIRDSHTDSYSQGEQTNDIIETKDSITDVSHFNNTITETKQGNQGVTSTQSLIEQERQVALFTVFDVIWCDILDNCFLWIWE